MKARFNNIIHKKNDTLKLKTNKKYYANEGDFPLHNALIFMLKFEFLSQLSKNDS